MAASFGGALSPTLAGYAMEEGALWRHSLLTAFAMNKVLAAVHGFSVDPSVAYTAGLIHDIGKVVMSHALDAATQSAVHELIDQGGSSLIEAEKRVVGADHAEIGACLLREWRLPEMLVEAVANHHVPPVAPRPQLSAVVHVADVIAHETGSSPGWGSFAVRAEEEAVQALGLESVDIEKLIMDTCDALDDIEGMLAVS
jgi:putative nucleotidyltransferase with HDIG domain